MIPKGISHTSVQNLTYEFRKRKIHFQQVFLEFKFGNSVLLKRGLLISEAKLPVTYIGFEDFYPPTGILACTAS
jgi:hypothetical protein